jgi:hypothetical protein
VHAYYNAYTKRLDPLADYATNPSIAVVSQFMCAPTDEEAERMAEGSSFFQFALGFYNSHGPIEPGSVDLWEEFLAFRTPRRARRPAAAGSSARRRPIRERLHRFADSHVDQVILLNQAGKNSHADIVSSLELFAAEVMPEFHALEGEQQAWKAAVLAGEIELEEIDTEAYSVRTYVDPSKAAAAG